MVINSPKLLALPAPASAPLPADSPWVTAWWAVQRAGAALARVVTFVDADLRRELAILPLMAATALGPRRRPISPRPDDGLRPVVFVHGLAGHPGNFRPLALHLHRRGHRRLYSIGLRPGAGAEEHARALSRFIEEVLAANDLEGGQVDLVAHSRGGIVSRLALDDVDTTRQVATLVTLGTPHQGTVAARFGRSLELDELRPDSAVVERLSQQLPWTGPPMVCLWSASDPLVVPPHRAQVPGATNIELRGLGHSQLLLWPAGWRAVHRALRGQGPVMDLHDDDDDDTPTPGTSGGRPGQPEFPSEAGAQDEPTAARKAREAPDVRDNEARRAQDDETPDVRDNEARKAQDDETPDVRDNEARRAQDDETPDVHDNDARRAQDDEARKAQDDDARRAQDDEARKAREKEARKAREKEARKARSEERARSKEAEREERARSKEAEREERAAQRKAQREQRARDKELAAQRRAEADEAKESRRTAKPPPKEPGEDPTDPKAERGPKWRRRKDARPEELIAAALELFAEQGYERTSLKDVGKKAGVSKATVYLYFKNKEDLLLAAVQRCVVPILDFADAYELDNDAPASEMIRTLLHRWVDAFDERSAGGLPRLVAAEAGRFPALGQLYVDSVLQRTRRLFQRLLKRGVREGEFADVDVRGLVHVLLAPALHAPIHQASLGPHDPSFPDVHVLLDRHLDLFLAAIRR